MSFEVGALARQSSIETDDRALPYSVEALDLRGRVVTLGDALDRILSRHAYPQPVSKLLGEAVVLATLLALAMKGEKGRFILQTQTSGPVSMLVVDVRLPGTIRATAGFDVDAVAALGPNPGDGDLLGEGSLAMTVEQGHSAHRYQGFTPLEGQGLEDAAHRYFEQSEQIPTIVRLAVAEMIDRNEDGTTRHRWRAGGLLAQFLPESEERMRRRDLPGGDNPNEMHEEASVGGDDDAWVEARALVETIEDHELTDPAISAERLLVRLFHERDPRVFETVALVEDCTCSRERIDGVLRQMSPDEIEASVENGKIRVTCEFCGKHYAFDPDPFRDRD